MSNKGPFNMDEEELDDLYNWVDTFPQSRAKRNLARDFSDGQLVCEIINSRFPGLCEIHNCVQSLNATTKKSNWDTLNRKVFSRMGFTYGSEDIADIVSCKPLAIEKMLKILKIKMDIYRENKATNMRNIYNNLISDKGLQPHRANSPERKSQNSNINISQRKNQASISHVRSAGMLSLNKNSVEHKPYYNRHSHAHLPVKEVQTRKMKANHDQQNIYHSENYNFSEQNGEYVGDLKDTIGILELKVTKLEQLVSLKEHKIVLLENSMRELIHR